MLSRDLPERREDFIERWLIVCDEERIVNTDHNKNLIPLKKKGKTVCSELRY